MKSSLTLALTLVSVIAAQGAHAFSRNTGYIESVNLESNTLTVVNRAGSPTEYQLADSTRVIIDGKVSTIAALSPEQKVVVKVPAAEKVEYVKAKIVNVDVGAGTAVVKPAGEEPVSIRFDADTKVGGKINSIEELAEGQSIKIRFAKAM